MTTDGRLPRTAGAARAAAKSARDLAEFLDEYAYFLDMPDQAEAVSELRDIVTDKLQSLREVVRATNTKMHQEDKGDFADSQRFEPARSGD